MTLSIVVITMNRAEQLCSALLSCIRSKLPEDTEFIIVDNASTDNTEVMVRDFFTKHAFRYVYEKEEDNLGVGGGRNRGFELAKGDFVYFLDDDAVIASESYNSFFSMPIALFQEDVSVASITTRIYDELFECDRAVRRSKSTQNSVIPEIFMFLGGSHFLRKQYYEKPLYLDFKYGMEELLPSIYAIDKGLKNCYIHQIMILHQPQKNKWESNSDELKGIVVNYNVNNYISKRLIYPSFFSPLLLITFICRTVSRFGLSFHMLHLSFNKLRLQKKNINVKTRRVKVKTILSIVKNYSFGTAF